MHIPNATPIRFHKYVVLKESETKKIVLATYAMAEEALDIKTLTTLILATPKTDVTQAVGRILRVKHERPTVIDIVDPHPTFQNQWAKRRAFYNKQGYTILTEF
jgi:superfamily II DNA or RNA helicase